ncbi:hypothetical protein LZ575_12990 [Antarcticibacterium sp. 1MA-6-2]|uniref:hypothetical protein n=1 Tax=Antarcticibacterium sp. 1MA-6-2 TaxID=2908210 RepID=UPI001F27A0D4|nr:hypothetical protein [Antarcticibacterium sp. 1MA-6-2]UJH89903.1 hypothetical protein LZ575_12990 [Antarcticibacterium sp. 1MA-6-2]
MMKIFLSAIITTSLMTLFSYIVSAFSHSQFREPQLLNELINRSTALAFKPGQKNLSGWIIHYSIGLLFVVIFRMIWNFTIIEPTYLSGASLGFIFGFIGITGWKIMFSLSPNPPEIKFKSFYLQLIAAHIIFGIGATLPFL